MENLRQRKVLFNQLLKLLQEADSLYTKMEHELVRGVAFDRAALILSGFTATLPMVLEDMGIEIEHDEEENRFHRELGRVMNQEKRRFKSLPKDPPTKDDEGNAPA